MGVCGVCLCESGSGGVHVCEYVTGKEREGGGGGFGRKNERKARVSGFPFQLKGSTPCF